MEPNDNMSTRRNVLRQTGMAVVGSTVVGTGVASAWGEAEPDVEKGAVKFGWYSGGRVSVPEGPLAVIDMEEAGGKWNLYKNAEEYGDFICGCHEVWEEYTTTEDIAANIKWHVFDYDGSVGIVLWERAWSRNEQPPEGFYEKWGSEDFDDESDYTC